MGANEQKKSSSVPSVPYPGEVVGEHPCPVCGVVVEHVHRPGRGRLYCTNSCRQRAYRMRRTQGIRLCVERNGPTRMLFNDRNHARRDARDPMREVRDRRHREPAVCGAFARPLTDRHRTHNQFVPEFVTSCRSCAALVGAGPYGTGIPEQVRQYWSG